MQTTHSKVYSVDRSLEKDLKDNFYSTATTTSFLKISMYSILAGLFIFSILFYLSSNGK